MSTSLLEFPIRRYQFTLVAFLCLVALGWYAFVSVPREEDPYFKIPGFTIAAIYPGADPKDLERLVAKPLEDKFAALDDVLKTETSIRDGVSFTAIEFQASGRTRTSGAMPIQNMIRKPCVGTRLIASTAASTPPREKPENIKALLKFRRCGGAYSTVSAIAVGTTPPRPRPVTNRRNPNTSGLGARAVAPIARENQMMLANMIRRRPTISVRAPTHSVPITMPVRA